MQFPPSVSPVHQARVERVSDTTYSNLGEAILCRQMQRRVALILKVGVPEVIWVITHDALDEREVVQENGAAETPRNINPASR